MKFVKPLAASALLLAVLLPLGGCSSSSDDKQPKAAGPADPNLKPAGRSPTGDPGSGKPGGTQSQGAVTKD